MLGRGSNDGGFLLQVVKLQEVFDETSGRFPAST